MQPPKLKITGTKTDINFLSEEDLDLASLDEEERSAVWDAWFESAQAGNENDANYYSHSCFGSYAPFPLGPKDWNSL